MLRCPEPVTGYREVRYPKMDAAREAVERDLGNELPKVEVEVRREAIESFRTPAGV